VSSPRQTRVERSSCRRPWREFSTRSRSSRRRSHSPGDRRRNSGTENGAPLGTPSRSLGMQEPRSSWTANRRGGGSGALSQGVRRPLLTESRVARGRATSPVPRLRLQPLPHRGRLSLAPREVVALNQPQHVLQHHLACLRKDQAVASEVSWAALSFCSCDRGGSGDGEPPTPHRAAASSGGISNAGTLTLTESTVSGNSRRIAKSRSQGRGDRKVQACRGSSRECIPPHELGHHHLRYEEGLSARDALLVRGMQGLRSSPGWTRSSPQIRVSVGRGQHRDSTR
jgi:hypothetical protein